ncbi:hypothetical protein ACFQ4O_13250, partial [Methylopila musalis]
AFRATSARAPAGDRPWSRAGPPPPEEALRLSFAPRLAKPDAATQAVSPPVDPTDPDDDGETGADEDQ